jgi:hypothetical protein
MNIPTKFVLYVVALIVCVEIRSLLVYGHLTWISFMQLLSIVGMVLIVFVITGGRPR